MTTNRKDIAAIYLAQNVDDAAAASNVIDGLARCDAVMALTPKLADNPDIAWAFDEARRLARSAPTATRAPWFRRPVLAWSTAGVAVSAFLVLGLVMLGIERSPFGPTSPPDTTADAGSAAKGLPTVFENQLADIDPVMLIADGVPVDGRSIAVLPLTAGSVPSGASLASAGAAAGAMYQRLSEKLAAVPGLYVIGPDMAAAYADTELTGEEIALFLGVRGVVQASVNSDGQTVSLDMQFTDAAGGGTAIEQRFTRPIGEMAMIEDDVMSSVLTALGKPHRAPEQPAQQ